MSEPTWIHLQLVNLQSERAHQESRACWCGPQFAIDVRPTVGREDVRVLLHRDPASAATDSFLALRSRKGEFVNVS